MNARGDLQHYLDDVRDALLFKLADLGEYDLRRPMTPTGTNLLGLVKHCAMVDAGYLGDCFGRPFRYPGLPDPEAPGFAPNDDMWVRAEESTEQVLDLFAAARAHASATLSDLPLDATGSVPWWGERGREVTLHRIAVHVIVDLGRHAGQADVVRESIDGAAGLRAGSPNLPDGVDWPAYRARVEAAAREASHDRSEGMGGVQ